MAGWSDPQEPAAWRARFERHSRSGLSVARFCAQERVSVPAFYYWRKKLKANAPRHRRPGPPASFQPVTVFPSAPGVSIHLPGGARIEVRAEDLDVVRAVVAEVARANHGPQRDGVSC